MTIKHALLFVSLALAAVPPARAQAVDASDPYRFVAWTVADGRDLGRQLVSRRALYGGAALGGLVVLFAWQDEPITDGAVELAEGTYRPVRRIANEIGNVKAVQPMALMIFLGSLTSEDTRFQDAAFTSLEAVLLSNLITDMLKGLVGRARPDQTDDAHVFAPLSGNTSFPSGHATTVFAFTTPWFLYYGGYRSTGLFLMGLGTAFTRMADRRHWFTDVVAGSAIGFTTAYWLTQRHRRAAGRLALAPVLAGGEAGVVLRVGL